MDFRGQLFANFQALIVNVEELSRVGLDLPADFAKIVVRNGRVEFVPVLFRVFFDQAVEYLQASFEHLGLFFGHPHLLVKPTHVL